MIKPEEITKHKLIGSGKFGNVYRGIMTQRVFLCLFFLHLEIFSLGEYKGKPCAIKYFIEKDHMNWIKFCQELGVILHLYAMCVLCVVLCCVVLCCVVCGVVL